MGKLTFIIVFLGGIVAAILRFKDKLFNMKAVEKQASVNEIKKDVATKTEEVKEVETKIEEVKVEITDNIKETNKETKKILKSNDVDTLVKEFDKW